MQVRKVLTCLAAILAGAASPALPNAPAASQYAVPVWHGPRAAPVFAGPSDPNYALRTVIRTGFAKGRLVAGHYALISIGCGTQCVGYLLGDVRTGKILTFPIGGEEYPALILTTRPDSRLIIANWGSTYAPPCAARKYLLTDDQLIPAGPVIRRNPRACSTE